MSKLPEFAWGGTNDIADVVNLHLYFFERALRVWAEAEALRPGLVIEPVGWRERACAAVIDAELSLSILLGQHSEAVEDQTPPPKQMAEALLTEHRKALARQLIKAAQDVRHFGHAKHESIGRFSRSEVQEMLENARLASIELLESKSIDAGPWTRSCFAII